MNDIISTIEKLDPQPKEALVIRFNTSIRYDVEQMTHICKTIQEMFPQNTVVGMPDSVIIERFSKEQLQQFVSQLVEFMGKMEEE